MAWCNWCKEELRFIRGRGWVHAGGGAYVQRCDKCGWKGAPVHSVRHCPMCKHNNVRDDHCALALNAPNW